MKRSQIKPGQCYQIRQGSGLDKFRTVKVSAIYGQTKKTLCLKGTPRRDGPGQRYRIDAVDVATGERLSFTQAARLLWPVDEHGKMLV